MRGFGSPQSARFTAQVDSDNAGTTILECIPGIRIAVSDLVQRVTGAIVVAEPSLLAELEAERVGLIDFALRIETGRGCEGRSRETDQEHRAERKSKRVTHGNT
ncbi:hypothetical protein ASF57_08230 [Methylobacterium sp. Leaf117]|nr:hypothetical protein ASF57_08230 [Methylobacterium sp. Leaf117]